MSNPNTILLTVQQREGEATAMVRLRVLCKLKTSD